MKWDELLSEPSRVSDADRLRLTRNGQTRLRRVGAKCNRHHPSNRNGEATRPPRGGRRCRASSSRRSPRPTDSCLKKSKRRRSKCGAGAAGRSGRVSAWPAKETSTKALRHRPREGSQVKSSHGSRRSPARGTWRGHVVHQGTTAVVSSGSSGLSKRTTSRLTTGRAGRLPWLPG